MMGNANEHEFHLDSNERPCSVGPEGSSASCELLVTCTFNSFLVVSNVPECLSHQARRVS